MDITMSHDVKKFKELLMAEIKYLKKINIHEVDINDEIMDYLMSSIKTNDNISTIVLNKTGINFSQLTTLLGLIEVLPIEELYIVHVKLDISHVGQIINLLGKIKKLSLVDNDIDTNGFKCLTDAIKSNKSLISFVYGNHMNLECIDHLKSMFSMNNTIKLLGLFYDSFEQQPNNVILYFLEWMESNKSVTSLNLMDLRYVTSPIGKRIFEMLRINNTLKELHLPHYSGGSELGYLSDALNVNKTLELLNFNESGINSNDFKLLFDVFLKNNTSVKTLNLNHVKMTIDDIRLISDVLKVNTVLKELHLSYTTNDGARLLLEGLKINRTLIYLNFTEDKILSSIKRDINERLLWNKKYQVNQKIPSQPIINKEIPSQPKTLEKNSNNQRQFCYNLIYLLICSCITMYILYLLNVTQVNIS